MEDCLVNLATPFSGILTNDDIKVYEAALSAEHIAVYKNMLLAVCQDTIKIYKFDAKATLKLMCSYQMSFLLFIKEHLKRDAITLIYKIFISLIEKGTRFKNAEDYICKLLDKLSFDKVEKVVFTFENVILFYSDSKIGLIDFSFKNISIKDAEILKIPSRCPDFNIKNIKNTVSIKLNQITIFKRKFKKVLQVDWFWNTVFILTSNGMISIIMK